MTEEIKLRKMWQTFNKGPVRTSRENKNSGMGVMRKIWETAISPWGCSYFLVYEQYALCKYLFTTISYKLVIFVKTTLMSSFIECFKFFYHLHIVIVFLQTLLK